MKVMRKTKPNNSEAPLTRCFFVVFLTKNPSPFSVLFALDMKICIFYIMLYAFNINTRCCAYIWGSFKMIETIVKRDGRESNFPLRKLQMRFLRQRRHWAAGIMRNQ
jgi:hypothetical protein